MTGSAYNAMDVFELCDSLLRVGVWGRDGSRVRRDGRLADCSKIIYIYIRKTHFLGFSKIIDFREVLGEVLERCWRGVFNIFYICSYYSAYRV